MIILGIDPGISCTGYGVVEKTLDNKIVLIELGVIRTNASETMPERINTIFHGVSEVIASLNPDVMAIESVFVGKNANSALKLGHARAAAILAGADSLSKIAEYSPKEVKQSITGNGAATKEQVQFMVKSILKLKVVPKPNDAADAVAVAMTYLQRMRFENKISALKNRKR